MPDEIDIIGDLVDPHIVVHHLDAVKGDTLQGRIDGFQTGSEPYVSFVDPDDEVDLTAFSLCIDELDNNPELGGVYTNSTTIFPDHDDIAPRQRYRDDHVWSIEWMRAPLPVHQLVVMRREVVLQSIQNLLLGPFPETKTVLAEQLIYAHMAVLAPFKFLNIDAYTWYCRKNSGHTRLAYDKKQKVRDYIWEIIDGVSPR